MRITILCLVIIAIMGCRTWKEEVILLDDKDGSQVTVTTARGSHHLMNPNQRVRIDADGNLEDSLISREEIRTRFGPLIDSMSSEPRSYTLYFEPNSLALTQASQPEIDKLLADVERAKIVDVEIVGHTDTVGKAESNDELSGQRAFVVQEMLVNLGLHSKLIRSYGRGERELLVSTPDETTEPRNRRVVVTIR